jgi:hypothetical protein
MQIDIFEGELKLGDSKDATMVWAQDFRVLQCALQQKKLVVECEGVQILVAAEEQREASSHAVYLDHTLVGRLTADRAEFTALPEVGAGPHRVAIHVSPFPGIGFCDDFALRKVTFSCE